MVDCQVALLLFPDHVKTTKITRSYGFNVDLIRVRLGTAFVQRETDDWQPHQGNFAPIYPRF